MTHESGVAIEDLTKDEVEHVVILLREVVDVLCRRQEGELYLMVDMMIDLLISGDTEEIASDARLAISQIHEFGLQENPALRHRGGRQRQRSGGHGSSHPRHTIPVCGRVPSPPIGTVTLLATMAPS